MSGWQPIETAPRDGTIILLVVLSGVSPEAVAVWPGWYDKQRAPFPWAFIDSSHSFPRGCCDHEDDTRCEVNGMPESLPPTHWMPLPAPPSEGQP